MKLSTWEPLRDMEDMLRRNWPWVPQSVLANDGKEMDWEPKANISQTDSEYVVRAELPAVKKEDIKVTLGDGLLTVSGERKQHTESKQENQLRVESLYGSFARSFSLPEDADAGSIKAQYKDGMLHIHIHRKPGSVSQPQTIPVQAA